MNRRDWIEVCRVLHAAEYLRGVFDAYASLYPDDGSTVRLRRICEQTWDRWLALWA